MSLLLVSVVTILFFIIQKIYFYKSLPPGPWGLPIIGSLLHLSKYNPITEFEKYRKKYGDLFMVGIGDFNVIVLNEFKLIRKALKVEEFQGKPKFEAWSMRNGGIRNRGIFLCDGPVWLEQRRFATRHLRDFGFGKKSIEDIISTELKSLLPELNKNVEKPFEIIHTFKASLLNSLWFITTGKRFELDDPELHRALNLLTTVSAHQYATNASFFFPKPTIYNLVRRGMWKMAQNLRDAQNALVQQSIDEHLKTFDDSHKRDLIDAYIAEIRSCENQSSSFNGSEGFKNCIVVMQDLFDAGTETSSTTLTWAMLFLARNPKIQDKLARKVLEVIGRDRLPTLADRDRLPYVEAVINETHRACSLVPFNVYHRVTQDTYFEGHFCPKDAVLFTNFYAAHHDKDYWGDPEIFRPERFMDANENKLIQHEALMPFSLGKRRCIGENMARDTLFLYITGIIQQYTVELDEESKKIDFDTQPHATIVRGPKPFNVLLRNRL